MRFKIMYFVNQFWIYADLIVGVIYNTMLMVKLNRKAKAIHKMKVIEQMEIED